MKPLNIMTRVMMVAVVAIGLTACGKKKNGGAVAATTPANTSTQTTCPANGQYTDAQGVVRACTPGQPVPTVPAPPNWNNQGSFQYGGCAQWEQVYGVPYVPVFMQQYGQYMCVRYDLLYGQQQYQQYQQYGYDYYYTYPPRTGSGCSNRIDFGGSWGNLGVCF